VTIETDLKKTFIQHVLGPRGGLFALGVFVGMGVMHLYMSTFVMDGQIEALKSQITGLQDRVEVLEAEKTELNERLQGIAFEKLGQNQK